jgi:homospermidine synthase
MMKTLQAQVPELLLREVQELAEKQNATVDQIVSVALAAQVSAWRTRESLASRAARVDWEKVDELLDRVPDVPADPGDEL